MDALIGEARAGSSRDGDMDENMHEHDEDDDGHPVHAFYTTQPDGLVCCNGCKKRRLFPHVARQTRHAIVCPHIPRPQRETLARNAAARKKTRRRFAVPDGAVNKHFQPLLTAERQAVLDAALTEFITANELPFRPFGRSLFKKFTSLLHTGYVPPSASALSGSLLDKHYLATQAKVQHALATAPWLSRVLRCGQNHRSTQERVYA